MQMFRYNTMRMYTSVGQLISVRLDNDGTVDFCDHSRNVDGRIKTKYEGIRGITEMLRFVMGNYDKCNYDHSTPHEIRQLLQHDTGEFHKFHI